MAGDEPSEPADDVGDEAVDGEPAPPSEGDASSPPTAPETESADGGPGDDGAADAVDGEAPADADPSDEPAGESDAPAEPEDEPASVLEEPADSADSDDVEETPDAGDVLADDEAAAPADPEPDPSVSMFGGEGPADDREMPLADHIEEMVKRLAIVIAVAGVVSLLLLPFAEQVVNFLWYSIMPGAAGNIARPRLYGILELWFTRIKVASLGGLIVALPVLVYETYAFMRPGLYPHERRYYLAAVPTSLVLALIGVSFAYFVVLPAIFTYFLYYSQSVATVGFALGRTFDLILLLMGYMALVFQIPLFIMLAMMMGLVTRAWLAGRRLLFWGAFLGISFLFSPDPTGMAPILVAATMITLFEGTLLLTRWTGTG